MLSSVEQKKYYLQKMGIDLWRVRAKERFIYLVLDNVADPLWARLQKAIENLGHSVCIIDADTKDDFCIEEALCVISTISYEQLGMYNATNITCPVFETSAEQLKTNKQAKAKLWQAIVNLV